MQQHQSRQPFSQRAFRRLTTVIAVAAFAAFAFQGLAAAATTVVVTQNTTTWNTADTRPGGSVSWSSLYGAPAGLGTSALRLQTDATNAAKAQLMTDSVMGTALSDVKNLAYDTYQGSASFTSGDASFQLVVDLCGPDNGYTTLVYEPYENGTVANGTWQHWDVSSGQFWSSKTVTCTTGSVTAGAGGPPYYTLAGLQAAFPQAVVLAVGANVGTYNPSYDVAVDGIQFNDTIYNFEIGLRPTSKDDCKNGGWMTFNDPVFPNQGQCIQYVNTGK